MLNLYQCRNIRALLENRWEKWYQWLHISSKLSHPAMALFRLQTGSVQDPVNILVGMDQVFLYKSHNTLDSCKFCWNIFKSKKEKYWPSCWGDRKQRNKTDLGKTSAWLHLRQFTWNIHQYWSVQCLATITTLKAFLPRKAGSFLLGKSDAVELGAVCPHISSQLRGKFSGSAAAAGQEHSGYPGWFKAAAQGRGKCAGHCYWRVSALCKKH